MLSVMMRVLPRLKLAWYFLLPWAGYLCALVAEPAAMTMGCTILIGWAMLLVYQFVKLGMVMRDLAAAEGVADWRSALALLPSLIPAGLVALHQVRAGGSLVSYFLEQFAMEVSVLLVAMVVVLCLEKNEKGRRSWQDLGPFPLLMGGLILAGLSGIGEVWWARATAADTFSIVLLGGALASEFRAQHRALVQLLRREVRITDFVTEPWGSVVILGQLVLWVGAGWSRSLWAG